MLQGGSLRTLCCLPSAQAQTPIKPCLELPFGLLSISITGRAQGPKGLASSTQCLQRKSTVISTLAVEPRSPASSGADPMARMACAPGGLSLATPTPVPVATSTQHRSSTCTVHTETGRWPGVQILGQTNSYERIRGPPTVLGKRACFSFLPHPTPCPYSMNLPYIPLLAFA